MSWSPHKVCENVLLLSWHVLGKTVENTVNVIAFVVDSDLGPVLMIMALYTISMGVENMETLNPIPSSNCFWKPV